MNIRNTEGKKMYTEIKPYQIIIQLLKERGIRHCVLSAGSRNVPFVHSIEEDSFFNAPMSAIHRYGTDRSQISGGSDNYE